MESNDDETQKIDSVWTTVGLALIPSGDYCQPFRSGMDFVYVGRGLADRIPYPQPAPRGLRNHFFLVEMDFVFGWSEGEGSRPRTCYGLSPWLFDLIQSQQSYGYSCFVLFFPTQLSFWRKGGIVSDSVFWKSHEGGGGVAH